MTRCLACRLLGLVLLLLSLQQSQAAAPSLIGMWLTQSGDGVVAISTCNGGLCGRLVGVFLDRATDPMPVDYRGVSQCNLRLITDARQIRPNLWKGHITDPRNGDVWGVELRLDPHGNLALRGFLGFPLLGHTEIWTRYPGTPPAGCRIGPRAVDAEPRRGLPNRPAAAR
jgi:uncharacterized protein (DUF2147 family)